MNDSLMTPEPSSGKPHLANLHNKSWPEEYLVALRQLVANGLTSNKIAALPMFRGRYSRGAIMGMARRLALVWKGSTGSALPKPVSTPPIEEPAPPQPPPPATPPVAPRKYRKVKLEDVVVPAPPRPTGFARRSIFALRRDDCRYITAGEGLEATYCCEPVEGPTSWCALHLPLVFGRTR